MLRTFQMPLVKHLFYINFSLLNKKMNKQNKSVVNSIKVFNLHVGRTGKSANCHNFISSSLDGGIRKVSKMSTSGN